MSIWGGKYKPGDNNCICPVCGFKVRASEMRLRWDGLMVCRSDWEPQHPQELMGEVRTEKIAPDVVATEPSIIEVTTTNDVFPFTFPLIFRS